MTQQTETHAKLVVDDEFKVGPVHDRIGGHTRGTLKYTHSGGTGFDAEPHADCA